MVKPQISSLILLFSTAFIQNKVCWCKPPNTDCFLSTNGTLLKQIFNITKEESESITQDLTQLKVSSKDVTFFLFTSKNQTLLLNSTKANELLNPNYQTKIITHGWKSNGTQQWVKDMAYLYHRKQNCNVIIVDWSKHSDQNYVHAAAATQIVGSFLGNLIVKLAKDSPLRNFHLIGHSLGAHVSGFAGKIVKDTEKQKVGRISGLDVAGPLFETPVLKDKSCRLTKSDATFVDCIHTKDGIGFISSVGHVDFYVNGGLIQPKCITDFPNIFSVVACGHGSSYDYFTKTIPHPHMYQGLACSSFARFSLGLCDWNRKAYMGEGVSRRASGDFYVNIDENSKQAD